MMISKNHLLALLALPYGSKQSWVNLFREGGYGRRSVVLDAIDNEVIQAIDNEELLRFLLEQIRYAKKQGHPKSEELARLCQQRLRVIFDEKKWSFNRLPWLSGLFQVARWMNFVLFAILIVVPFFSRDTGSTDLLIPLLPYLSLLKLLFFWTAVVLGQLRRRMLKSTLPFYRSESLLVNLVRAGCWLSVFTCLNLLLVLFLPYLFLLHFIQFGLILWMRYRIYSRANLAVWEIGTDAFVVCVVATFVCLFSIPKLVSELGWLGLLIPIPGLVFSTLFYAKVGVYSRGLVSSKKTYVLSYVCWWLIQQAGLLLATSWSLIGWKSPIYLAEYGWLYAWLLLLVLGSSGLMAWLIVRIKTDSLATVTKNEAHSFVHIVSQLYSFVRTSKKRSETLHRFELLANFASQASLGWFSVLSHTPLAKDLRLLEQLLEESFCQYILADLTWLKSLYPNGWERAEQLLATSHTVQYKEELSKMFEDPEIQSHLLEASNRLVQQELMLFWKTYDYYQKNESDIMAGLS